MHVIVTAFTIAFMVQQTLAHRPLARIEKLGVHFTEGAASQSVCFRPRRVPHMQNVRSQL